MHETYQLQEARQDEGNINFSWLAEGDVSIYFSKLDKEQERLKKMAIKWDDNQKVTQAMQKIYNSSFFNQKHIMEWEDKYDVVCKMFFQK